MHSDDFDKRMRDRLRAYEEEPAMDTWAEMQAEIQRTPQPLHRRLSTYEDTPDETVWRKVKAQQRFKQQLWWTEQIATIAVLLLLLWLPVRLPSNQPITSPIDVRNPFGSHTTTTDSLQTEVNRDPLSNQKGIRRRGTKSRPLTVVDSPGVKTTEPVWLTHNILPDKSETQLATGTLVDIADTTTNRKEPNESLKEVAPVVDSLAATFDETVPMERVTSADEKKKKESTSSFYFLAMPTLGYQRVSPVLDDGIIVESYERVASFSPRRLGVRVELGWEQKISPHLSADLALLYFQRKQTIGYTYFDSVHYDVEPVVNTPMTYEISPTPLPGSFEYEVRNVGVLVGFNYTIKSGAFVQRFGVAAELHKNLKRDAFYLFGDVYYRLSYQVGKRVELMVQPTMNYTLRLVENLNAPFYVKPYGLGLSVGAMVRVGGSPNKE